MEEFAVGIERFAPKKDLQITNEMSNNKAEQDDARNSHNRLLTDGGLIEPEGTVQVAVNCD